MPCYGLETNSSLRGTCSITTPNDDSQFSKQPLKFYLETSIENQGNVYNINLQKDDKRVEGNYHFFVVCFEISGKQFNAYVSAFDEDTTSNDNVNYFSIREQYVKYLTSGNRNIGENFIVYKRDPVSNEMSIKERIPNRSILTPTLLTMEKRFEAIDMVILPIVNVIQKKDRRGNVSQSYEIAFASDLNEQCHLLFRYINAIHASRVSQVSL